MEAQKIIDLARQGQETVNTLYRMAETNTLEDDPTRVKALMIGVFRVLETIESTVRGE